MGWRVHTQQSMCYSARVGKLLICPSRCVRPHGFFALGYVFPSQYRPGGTGRIRNGFYRSKNSYLIHHSIVFSAWQLVLKSVIQVNRQLDLSGGFKTWLSASW